ncbi:MAG TPA: IS3 family transposase [Casimicrobiaceae bacterium]
MRRTNFCAGFWTRYETRDTARADVFEYIKVFYNRFRRHSSLDGVSPVTFHETWLKQQSARKAA